MTESNRDRPRRVWRIPNRLFGRVRTSTVAFGIFFILTSLLYNQIQSANEGEVTGPTAIDPSQFATVPQQSGQQPAESATTVPTTTSLEPTTTADPSGSDGSGTVPGQSGSSTEQSGTSTTPDPTYLPGLTVPPGLRSLFPPEPSATGTP